VAAAGATILGFADCFVREAAYPEVELFCAPGGDQLTVGEALLSELSNRTRATSGALRVWTSDDLSFPVPLLLGLGYRRVRSKVFMVQALSLDGLVADLLPLWRLRLAAVPVPTPSTFALVCPDARAVVPLGGPTGELELRAPTRTLVRVLCGALSAWGAYLDGELDVVPTPVAATQSFLETVLPAVPFRHPVDDWW
jgi:hypothetical protein